MSDDPLSPASQDPSATSPAGASAASGRRTLLFGAVALSAAGLGAWWATTRQSRRVDSAPQPAGDPLPQGFWQKQFDRPGGGSLDWAAMQGSPLLINFWATWCPPCVKEMPELDRFHRTFAPQGWQVVGLAIDGPTPVREFLGRTPVGFPVGLAGLEGTDLAAALGNTAGGLPFSVLIDARGRIRQRKMGATHFDELSAWAAQVA